MRVTPLDIIQKQFGPARRGGYDSDEVRAFLDEVRDALEESLKDNQRLREQLQRRESEIVELRSGEGDIKDTLLLARRLSEDMERAARREADVILGEARLEAEKVLQTAAEERRALQAELVADARRIQQELGWQSSDPQLEGQLERGVVLVPQQLGQQSSEV